MMPVTSLANSFLLPFNVSRRHARKNKSKPRGRTAMKKLLFHLLCSQGRSSLLYSIICFLLAQISHWNSFVQCKMLQIFLLNSSKLSKTCSWRPPGNNDTSSAFFHYQSCLMHNFHYHLRLFPIEEGSFGNV